MISNMSSRDISTYDRPTYGYPEAAQYLRLNPSTLRTWASPNGLIRPASPGSLSWNNLAEMHVLKSLRRVHGISHQAIRKALQELSTQTKSEHPLLDPSFETDGVDLFINDAAGLVNLSRRGQRAMRDVISLYLQRIGRDAKSGQATHLFPFIAGASEDEPEHVSINPNVSFGKSVIAGTGISTAVIAGRFAARDSIASLAEEYEVAPELIEDAIRWEAPQAKAA
jgi:uncharacterized protein (DUF433 family)